MYRGMLPYKENWCTVAIKVMSEDGVDQSAVFDNEIRLLGSVRHPKIVRLLGEISETSSIITLTRTQHEVMRC